MSPRQKLNEEIAEKLEEMHSESPDKGYRRLRDDLEDPCQRQTSVAYLP